MPEHRIKRIPVMAKDRCLTTVKSSSFRFLLCLLFTFLVSSDSNFRRDPNNSDDNDNSDDEDTLVAVQVVFRHGSRSPVKIYPTNPNTQEKAWPMGLSQLTPQGVEDAVALGSFLGDEYIRRRHFLGPEFQVGEIVTRSSDTDRTLMSAQALARGLYPKSLYPLPVHTVPMEQDRLLVFPLIYGCKAYYDMVEHEYESGTYIDELREEISPFLLDSIFTKCGYSPNEEELINMWKIEDNIRVDMENRLPVPPWVTPEVLAALGNMSVANLIIFNFNSKMVRIGGGPLFKKIIENFKAKMKNQTKEAKMFLYSAHDLSITYLLSILQNWLPHLPAYCASITFELWRSGADGSYFLKIWHRDAKIYKHKSKILTIKGCSSKCGWDQFLSLTEDYLPANDTEFEEMCGIKDATQLCEKKLDTIKALLHNATTDLSELRHQRTVLAVATTASLGLLVTFSFILLIRCVVSRLRQPWDPPDATKHMYRLFNNHHNNNNGNNHHNNASTVVNDNNNNVDPLRAPSMTRLRSEAE